MEFMKEPALILKDQAAVVEAIANKTLDNMGLNCWFVKSVWLIELIDEIAKRGDYPYNQAVMDLAIERTGIDRTQDNLSHLGRLIYNAQKYRTSDKLIADGYVPFTQALIDELGVGGKLGSESQVFTIKNVEGKLYAMLPRKKVMAGNPLGQPIKVLYRPVS